MYFINRHKSAIAALQTRIWLCTVARLCLPLTFSGDVFTRFAGLIFFT